MDENKPSPDISESTSRGEAAPLESPRASTDGLLAAETTAPSHPVAADQSVANASAPDEPLVTIYPATPPRLRPARPFIVQVFIGPAGLRAGWRFLIYVVMVALFGGALNRVMRALGHGHRTTNITAWTTVISEAIVLAVVLVPSLIMGAFERRSLSDFYLPLRHVLGRRFWEGALWGFVALSVLLIGIRTTGDFYFGHMELHGRGLLYYGAVWGLAFTLVGLVEEYALRGYSLFTLASGMGFWPAALILSVVFALLHTGNPGETAVGILEVVAIALFFCLTIRRTGNLWFAIGFHAAWDWGETFFYGVPNSGMIASGHLLSPQFQGSRWITGGTAGPEGSVFSIVLTCVLTAAFAMRFRARAHSS
jgi:CAAX protease family protein